MPALELRGFLTDPSSFEHALREILGPRAKELSPDSRGLLRKLWERGVKQGAQQAGVLPLATETLEEGLEWARKYSEAWQKCEETKNGLPEPQRNAATGEYEPPDAWNVFHGRKAEMDEALKERFNDPLLHSTWMSNFSGEIDAETFWVGLSDLQSTVAAQTGARCRMWIWPGSQLSLLRRLDAAHPAWDQIRLQGNDPLVLGYLFDVPVLGAPWLWHKIWGLFLDAEQHWKIGEHRLPDFRV